MDNHTPIQIGKITIYFPTEVLASDKVDVGWNFQLSKTDDGYIAKEPEAAKFYSIFG
jgi:hypothetical protein